MYMDVYMRMCVIFMDLWMCICVMDMWRYMDVWMCVQMYMDML